MWTDWNLYIVISWLSGCNLYMYTIYVLHGKDLRGLHSTENVNLIG